jgi:hypothetical protein
MMVPLNSFPFKSARKFGRLRPSMMMAFRPSRAPSAAPTGSTGACRPGFHLAGISLRYSRQVSSFNGTASANFA